MKKRIKMIIWVVALFCITITGVKAQESEIYNQEVGENTVETINTKWKTNHKRKYTNESNVEVIEDYNRITKRSLTMDGVSEKKNYLYYYNVDQIVNASGKADYLTITIDDLNINTASYNDIRVFIDYATTSPGVSLVKTNSLIVNAIDENSIPHTFFIDDYTANGFYKYGTTSTIYLRGFDIITENIKESSDNYIIKKLEIIPYGNVPVQADERKTLAGDWREQGTNFYLSSVKVVGYSGTGVSYEKKNVTYEDVDTTKINNKRIKAAHRLYDLATLKWSPSINMSTIRSVNGFSFSYENTSTGELKYYYTTDNDYYGPFYTQRNRVTVEKLYSVLDNNKKLPALTEKYYLIKELDNNNVETGRYYTVKEPDDTSLVVERDVTLQSRDIWGDDSSASVSYSVSKYLPINDMYTTTDFIWDRNKTTLLGGLNINGKAYSSRSVYDELYNQYLSSTSSSPLDSSSDDAINQRIRTNTKQASYLSVTGADDSKDNIVNFKEAKSTATTPAIDGDESLKLTINNLLLQSGQEAKLTFKYYIYTNLDGTNYDQNLDTDKLIIRFCTSTNCANATNVTLSTKETISSKYATQVVTATYTPISNITRVEIIPYGETPGVDTKNGKVFSLNELIIKVNNVQKYRTSASAMSELLSFQNYKESDDTLPVEFMEKINGELSASDKTDLKAKFLARQDIYRGYKELMIGDVVSTHSKEGYTHVRLITGNTHVECMDGVMLDVSNSAIDQPHGSCDSHGGIDPEKSYYIRSDISSSPIKTTEVYKNNYGGLIDNEEDYVAAKSWTPNNDYTDVKASDIMGIKRSGESSLFLQGKNVNYYLNYKNSFQEGIEKSYLPITFNDYSAEKIEEPYATLINPNTTSNIKDGLKGSLYSNYQIISIKVKINDNHTKTEYQIHPNHAADTKETGFVNEYSFSYNLPDDDTGINEALNNLSDNYDVKVLVETADQEIEVLHLTTLRYKVTFDSNGGSSVDHQDVLEGEKATRPTNPTKTRSVFKGWYKDSGLTEAFDFDTPITNNMTLYAKWDTEKYTVTFNSNGGSVIPAQTNIEYGGYASKPTDPTYEDNTFKGWFQDEQLTIPFNFATQITASITLYAKWEGPKFTVTFDSNGGSTVTPQSIERGHTATKPKNPTKTDYIFKGWYKDSDLTEVFDFETPITEEITLYAKWKEKPPVYTYIEGANQTYKPAEGKEAVFRIDADFNLFKTGGSVYVDDKLVDADNYTAESGSTIIKFKKEYMSGLSETKHELRVEFNNGGTATTHFMVQSENSSGNPDTADTIIKWIGLFVLSIIGLSAGTMIIKTIKEL